MHALLLAPTTHLLVQLQPDALQLVYPALSCRQLLHQARRLLRCCGALAVGSSQLRLERLDLPLLELQAGGGGVGGLEGEGGSQSSEYLTMCPYMTTCKAPGYCGSAHELLVRGQRGEAMWPGC